MKQKFLVTIEGIGFSDDRLTFTADEIRDILFESDEMEYHTIKVEEEEMLD